MPLRRKFFLPLLLCLLLSGPALKQLPAQERPAPESKTENTAASQKEPVAQEQDKQEQEKDENEALKHSPVVEFIAHKTGLTVDQAYWLVVVFNFAIVLGILGRLLGKMLPGEFKARNEALQSRMEEARKATQDARVRLADVQSRLAGLDVEIARMRREAEESARAEEERIRASSEEERRRIVESAELEIVRAASAARRELKSYVAGLAVDLAEKKIKIAASADQTLVREFTAQIGKEGN
jgi:F-type H+-transporting ATPase subunit b